MGVGRTEGPARGCKKKKTDRTTAISVRDRATVESKSETGNTARRTNGILAEAGLGFFLSRVEYIIRRDVGACVADELRGRVMENW